MTPHEGRVGWQRDFICTASSRHWESIVILTTTLTTTLAITGKQRRTQPLEKSGLKVSDTPQKTDWLEFLNRRSQTPHHPFLQYASSASSESAPHNYSPHNLASLALHQLDTASMLKDERRQHMADKEHLALVKQKVAVWNKWRREHPGIDPKLSRANLNHAPLSGADLSKANLQRANLRDASLSSANLSDAILNGANLRAADLRMANLSRANLRAADLSGANLSGADLSGADLNQAKMAATLLTNLDLRFVKGLDTIEHVAPSDIGIQTLSKSQGKISEVFLHGAGIPDRFIRSIPLWVDKPIEHYSCFISYSSKDEEFARQLYNDLQDNDVRCWFAPENLKIGDEFLVEIDRSIRIYDKLLVILSKHSVESSWVKDEVMRALDKERQQPERIVLFPIRLDDVVMKTNQAWTLSIRISRHIGDFSGWENHDAYQKAFDHLLHDLITLSTLP